MRSIKQVQPQVKTFPYHKDNDPVLLSHFPSTGLCYRNAKAYDKSRQAYERAAEAHYKNAAYPQKRKNLYVYCVSSSGCVLQWTCDCLFSLTFCNSVHFRLEDPWNRLHTLLRLSTYTKLDKNFRKSFNFPNVILYG